MNSKFLNIFTEVDVSIHRKNDQIKPILNHFNCLEKIMLKT